MMKQGDIIRMAREAGLYLDGENQQQPMYILQPEELIRFAALVAAAEREACAKVCADLMDSPELIGDCHICIDAIRAMREHMTPEDIIRMAQEAGFETRITKGKIHGFDRDGDYTDEIKTFAALVAAAEREACAKLVGELAQTWWSIHCASNKHMETTRKAHDAFCALQAAIRARGNT